MVLRILMIATFIFLATPSSVSADECCWVSNDNRCYIISNETCVKTLKGKLYEGAECIDTKCYRSADGKLLNLDSKVSSSDFRFQVPFPGSDFVEKKFNSSIAGDNVDGLGFFIVAIFRLGVYLAITFAIFMIMFAGFLWLSSGGSRERITKAQDYIKNSIAGLVIALTSFIILQTVNPSLTVLRLPRLNVVENLPTGGKCCYDRETNKIKFINALLGKDGKQSNVSCADALGKTFSGQWEDCPDWTSKIKTCCDCQYVGNYQKMEDFRQQMPGPPDFMIFQPTATGQVGELCLINFKETSQSQCEKEIPKKYNITYAGEKNTFANLEVPGCTYYSLGNCGASWGCRRLIEVEVNREKQK